MSLIFEQIEVGKRYKHDKVNGISWNVRIVSKFTDNGRYYIVTARNNEDDYNIARFDSFFNVRLDNQLDVAKLDDVFEIKIHDTEESFLRHFSHRRTDEHGTIYYFFVNGLSSKTNWHEQRLDVGASEVVRKVE